MRAYCLRWDCAWTEGAIVRARFFHSGRNRGVCGRVQKKCARTMGSHVQAVCQFSPCARIWGGSLQRPLPAVLPNALDFSRGNGGAAAADGAGGRGPRQAREGRSPWTCRCCTTLPFWPNGSTYAAAARELGMAQSTLSRHISDLERELRATLFSRGAKLELTPCGRVLLEETGEFFATEERLARRLAEAKRIARGTVRLEDYVFSQSVKNFMLQGVYRFKESYPGVSFEFTPVKLGRPITDALAAGEFDVGVLVHCGTGGAGVCRARPALGSFRCGMSALVWGSTCAKTR